MALRYMHAHCWVGVGGPIGGEASSRGGRGRCWGRDLQAYPITGRRAVVGRSWAAAHPIGGTTLLEQDLLYSSYTLL